MTARVELARARSALGRHEQAREDLGVVVGRLPTTGADAASGPLRAQTFFALGVVEQRLGHLDAARAARADALAAADGFPAAPRYRARIEAELAALR